MKCSNTSQDSIFERMTFDQWQAAFNPKHAATWNLHNQLPKLDFFIMLSSLTGVAGNTGLANYSAACAFQDAFARWRTSHGLPAVSIDLGPVRDIGYVAENRNVVERVAKLGWIPLKRLDTMRIVEPAMLLPCRSPDLQFSSLQKNITVGEKESSDFTSRNKIASFKDTIARVINLEQASQCCTDVLVRKLADMFSLQVADVDSSLSLAA